MNFTFWLSLPFLLKRREKGKERKQGLWCPWCESPHVRRSHRRNRLERYVSLLRLYPFRCERCDQRFGILVVGKARPAISNSPPYPSSPPLLSPGDVRRR